MAEDGVQVRCMGLGFGGVGVCGEGCLERIRDIMTINFTEGLMMGNVHQLEEDNLSAEEELRTGVS